MRVFRFIAALLFSGALLGAAAFADDPSQDVSQMDAQTYATVVNQAGSDQSLQRSAVTAMQALIQFGDSNLQGGFANAYRAYSSFKNSENLDRAHKQALLAKSSMGAVGTVNLTDQEMSFLTSVTSYRRLDPSFLSSSDNSAIVGEFEKKTGIKGQDFLGMLSSLSESKLYASDPNLGDKVDAQIDSFLSKIPNAEYREKAADALAMVPTPSRHQILAEAVQTMLKVASKFSGSSGITVAAAQSDAKAKAADGDRTPAAVGDAGKEDKDEDMGFLARNLNADVMGKAGDEGKSKLDGVIKAAIHDDPESETIFEQVSRRYRILTSDLVPPKETANKNDT